MNNGSSPERIAADLRAWVDAAPPGAQLPSTRSLVARHGASPVTVQRALRLLAADGLVETRPGVGTFVRAARATRAGDHGWQTAAMRAPQHRISSVAAAMRAVDDDALALHSGYPDADLLPARQVRAALTRAARGEAALTRGHVAGLPELRAWFARELAAETPAGIAPPSAADVVVVPGTQSGLSSLFRSLVAPGQALVLESPTYWGAILAAQQAGVRVVPVPSGPAGPDPVELERALEESGARVFYAQPTFANPTGALWSLERRRAVLDVVRDCGAFVVEDDWAHDFALAPPPPPLAALDDAGHVVHLRSLTKSLSPALRVGAVVARGPVRERVLADRGAESLYVSSLLQAAALDVVTQPAWRSHLRRVRDELAVRRDLLRSALAEHAPDVAVDHVPAGGLHLWGRLPDGTGTAALAAACERRGLLLADGAEWFPAEPTGPHLRLNFSGPRPDAFARAARILGEELAAQRA